MSRRLAAFAGLLAWGLSTAAPVPAVAATAAAAAAAGGELKLLRITPEGEDVEPGNQIVFSFDRAVVPLGRMERKADEIPITITPALPCEWRWLDPQALACQLPENAEMLPATVYEIDVRPEFVADSGARLLRGREHRFITQRPILEYASVDHWQSPTEPVIRALFSQPVTAASIVQSGRIAGEALIVQPDPEDRDTPYYVPAQGGAPASEARRQWHLRPAKPLKPDQDGFLKLSAGLVSALGTESGVADDEAARFHTFPTLKLLGLRCNRSDGRDGLFAPGDRTPLECDPLSPVSLVFNVPVVPATAAKQLTITPDPSGGRKDYDPWANASNSVYVGTNNVDNGRYAVWFPFTLKANAEYRVEGTGDIRDIFDRKLGKAIDLRFRTAHRSPALSFEHDTAVLEAGIDSEVPAIVTNLDRLKLNVTRTTADGVQAGLRAERPVAAVKDVAFAMPLDIRKLLDGRSGVIDGWLTTAPATAIYSAARPGQPLFAEVTPWQVHAKFGHYNTLVWVTEFATGKPVADADVTIFGAAPPRWQPSGDEAVTVRTDAAGLAELPGSSTLDPQLERSGWDPKSPLAVEIRKGGDIAVLPLTSTFSVDTYRASNYRIYASRQRRHGHLKSWGTTAQGVYRAGDTIQYKLYVRNNDNRALAPAERGPYQLVVLDPADQVVHERDDVSLSEFGAIDGAFTVPKQGKVGWYRFELHATFAGARKPSQKEDDAAGATLNPMQVLVSDFTPAPFKLATEIRAKRIEPGQPFTAVLRASLHAGGAFGDAPATLIARVEGRAFEPEGPLASKFSFGADGVDGSDARGSRSITEKHAATDAQGEFSASFTAPESDIAYGVVQVEGSAQDDRGRSIASAASAPYAGRDRYIGLLTKDWLLTQGKATSVDTLVVDGDGKPVAGVPRYVKIERREVLVARVKDVGNAYVARYSERWVDVAICKGRSAAGAQSCAFTPDAGGSYRITALVRDTRNRLHRSQRWLWAAGKNSFVWEQGDDYGLSLEADRKTYKVGDVARVLVKNPYPGATALITTERYGVIEKRTQVLEGSTPVIEVKITPDHLPGFYLSVVVQSPRVASPPTEGDVDLGKPTFRMGYTTISVDDPYKRIDVEVTADKPRYQPRETAKVSLKAVPVGAANGEKIELAVAVVDEAVYDLIRDGELYFDPYQGFNALDSLDLANYSLLTRLVGRQKFEKKGATPGGDGGADLSLRSVDKFVAYWNPALATDAAGNASIAFSLPDNLTAWKVLVLAVTPNDRFGLGSGKLIATKDTELRPLMPNQVTSGDAFAAGFSVLNRADVARSLKVVLDAKGAATAHLDETVTLAPFERKVVRFDIAAELADNAPGSIEFTATASDARDKDGLTLAVPVKPRKPTVTAADFGFLDSGQYTQPILVPDGSLPGGAISVTFTPTVLGNLDGAFRYVRDYPYGCWEQRLTTGVMAAQFGKLKPYLDPKLAWPEASAITPQLFADAASFQAPSGGMTYWDGDEAHVSPYLSAYTALAFEWLRAEGQTPPEAVQAKLDRYLDGLMRRDIAGQSAEASSAVRAVTLAALARRGKLKVADLERQLPSAPRMGLFGQALFLDAARHVDGGAAPAKAALDLLLARGQESAGLFTLRETDDRGWAALLGSELRGNCAALAALVGGADRAIDGDPGLAEIPAKLVRSISQARGGRDHWENTQENVFCSNALAAYSQRYESTVPAFSLSALLDARPLGSARFKALRDPQAVLSHPIVAADIGKQQSLDIRHEGQGRGYFAARVSYVERDENARATNAGLTLKRRYAVRRNGAWVPLQSPMTITRGETVRIELTMTTPSDRSFIVVDDPVPGGLEPLNPDLATSSGLDAEDASPPGSGDPYPFYHRELRFEAARWFADHVEAGSYTLYWIGQAVSTGTFAVTAPHAEAMYDPDVFGNDVPARLVVVEAATPAPPAPAAPASR